MIETSHAFAKINLSLDIISKMSDGYHYLKTVMQTVSLSDEITIECVPGKGAKDTKDTWDTKDTQYTKAKDTKDITIVAGLQFLPTDERNIAVKAARTFFAHTGITGYKTNIRIKKHIPVSAGLGGGSTDGACVLRLLDKMFDTKLGRSTLETLGKSIGSDVPFCIAGGTCLAEGRGEILTDLTSIPQSYFVICKPPFVCSTPELFRHVKCEKIHARPDTNGIIASLNKRDLSGVARRMYNVFEDILPRGARDIAEIKYALLDYGALGAVMTGSGPTVFGLFDSESQARKAFEHLKTGYRECFFTGTVDRLEGI